MALTLNHFLVLSAVIFAIGLFGALSKRNTVAILMCIELMFNAINISLVAFSRFGVSQGATPEAAALNQATGQVFALFIIAVAAAEASVALAILLSIYRSRRTVSVEDINLLKW